MVNKDSTHAMQQGYWIMHQQNKPYKNLSEKKLKENLKLYPHIPPHKHNTKMVKGIKRQLLFKAIKLAQGRATWQKLIGGQADQICEICLLLLRTTGIRAIFVYKHWKEQRLKVYHMTFPRLKMWQFLKRICVKVS